MVGLKGGWTTNKGLDGIYYYRAISPPSGTDLKLFPHKLNNEIKWTFDGNASIRTWFFTRRGDTARKTIASISSTGDITVFSKSLPGVSVTPPATLALENVDQDFNGKYEFQLTLDDGSSSLSYLNVYITAKPNVTSNCSGTTTLNEGDNFSCLCKDKDGNPPADVTWFKDGEQIGETGKKEQMLTLKNVHNTDSGTYKCVAESDPDERYKDEKTIKIIVQFKPRKPELIFTSNLASLGGSFTISCSSDGVPEPSYNITHNGTEVSTEKSLTISPVKWSDAGRYECFVKNNLGNDSVSKDLKVTGDFVFPNGKIGLTPTAKPTTTNSPNPSKGTTTPKVKGKDKTKDEPLPPGVIAGIVIGVLAFILIIAGVVYYFYFRSGERAAYMKPDGTGRAEKLEDGYRGKRDVSPGGRNDNQYEMGDNEYDTVKPGDGGEGSGEKPKKKNQPPVYAQVDKENRQGKPLYATLDTVALDSGGSKKRDEGRAQPTEYAAIDHGRTGDVPRADLV
ncbi:hemicentin-2-like [Dendronephthya gigantea]|uniref:hemicentin-2-like n=1 Tax=Dendronephthya gigantea TaxID=151771 RepID=UPI00106D0B50|nr:hemicentin-2-like [Dendronephthya gigantea]